MDSDLLQDTVTAVNNVLGEEVRLQVTEDKRVQVISENIDPAPILQPIHQRQVTKDRLFSVFEKCGQSDALLVAPHISHNISEQLREAGVFFADTAGNCYIDKPGLLIFITGRKATHKTTQSTGDIPQRMFHKTGVVFLFELMVRKFNIIDAPYRQIRDETGISLGSVGWILSSLKENGFLIEDKQGRRVVDKQRLLKEWCVAYRRRLRPAHFSGFFRSRHRDDFENMELPPGVRWGAEPAATRLGAGLRPGTQTVYATATVHNRFLAQAALREDPEGDIEIMTAFWQEKTTQSWPRETVHPLLVYADLITSGNRRSIEAAEEIYNLRLKEIFEENT